MSTTTRTRRRYDHRLRLLAHQTRDVQLAIQNGVPRSTARDWSRLSTPDVVSLDVLSMSQEALQQEVFALRRLSFREIFISPLIPLSSKTSVYLFGRIEAHRASAASFSTIDGGSTRWNPQRFYRVRGGKVPGYPRLDQVSPSPEIRGSAPPRRVPWTYRG